MARLEPFFPRSHGKPRVDNRTVSSEIICIKRNKLRWRDAPEAFGPHKALYSLWKRWSEKGVFVWMMAGLSAEQGEQKTVMIDATYLKAHRTWASKRGIGRTRAGMNIKLHAIFDRQDRPLNFFVTAGQVSDHIGARGLLSSLPDVDWLLGDRGYTPTGSEAH